MEFDMIIHNGTILSMNDNFDIMENGILGIEKGKIKFMQAKRQNHGLPFAKTYIDAKGGIIMPGLVNGHTHLPMTLFRGLADDLPLKTWLNEYIFPAEANHICSKNVYYGSLIACAELIASGTTTICDGYFLEDSVGKAVQETGLRAVIGQGIIDFPAPGVPDPGNNIKTAWDFVETWKDKSPFITPSVFCHSPYTCSGRTLKKAKAAANKKEVKFQIHVAETMDEKKHIETQHGLSPVAYLDSLGILDELTILVHAVWIDDNDIEIIARKKCSVIHNPESNMKLASGISPVPGILKAGITTGLGTDGCASNNDLDLFCEMDTTAKLHKVANSHPEIMDAKTVLKMATIEGAKAIGLSHITGSLEPGKQADIIVLDTEKAHLTPLFHPESHVVYCASGSDVRDVIIGGNLVFSQGEFKTVDIGKIFKEIKRIALSVFP